MPESAVQEREESTTDNQEKPQPAAAETGLERRSAAASIGFGMNARNWDEGFRIANQLAQSNLVPKAYYQKAQDIVVAMQLGAELGLPPMQSLQSIAVINGRPGVYGDGFLAVIMSSPSYLKHAEYYVVRGGEHRVLLTGDDLKDPDTTAVCSFWRRGIPEPFTATFSIADATRAGLLGKEGPWRNYPARMLRFRARGFAGRDAFAAELRGMRTAEELQDIPMDVAADVIQQPSEPVRRSEKPVAAAAETDGATASSGDAVNHAPAAEKSAGSARTARAAEKPAGPGQVTKNVQVMDTSYVGRLASGDPYTEVKGVIYENGKPGLGFTWVTRDEQIAKLAESCAGSDKLFTITWHEGKLAVDASKGKTVKVLTGLQAAD